MKRDYKDERHKMFALVELLDKREKQIPGPLVATQ